MASVALSAGHVLPIRRPEVRSAVRPARKWSVTESLGTMAEVASGLLFMGVLGWEVWRIGGCLVQLVVQMASAATGSGPVVHAADFVWPSGGPWPW